MKIKALKEEKGRLIEELNGLQNSINTEARSMTETEKLVSLKSMHVWT